MSEVTAPVFLYLVHDASLELNSVVELACDHGLQAVPWADRETIPAQARVLLLLGDEQIRDLATLALARAWEIGVLPHENAPEANTAMGVKGDIPSLIEHYRQCEPVAADAITCNGELMFSSVVIGRVLSLRPYDINLRQTNGNILRGALKGLTKLRMHSFKLTTRKEQNMQLAALGMVGCGHTQSSLAGRRFDDTLSTADGRISLLVLAPRSVLSYLWFIVRLLMPGKMSLSRLPPSLGLVQSDSIKLTASKGIEYLLDGKPVQAKEIQLLVLEQRLSLLPGPLLGIPKKAPQKNDRETIRLNNIPVNEGAKPLTEKPMPFFSHAGEDEYRELFRSLRDSAQPSSTFQVLMILSVMLALMGLYANSAPVIIGAMILAPLMAPIVSLAMGLARSEPNLIRGSLRTMLIGVVWGLLCAVLLSWAMPLDRPTPEMVSRMSPNLLDLMIAVISGIAGAYAFAKEEIAKSLAGVAIAVALVPPLSVAGIGLGWGNWEMARGAFLLLSTNLVGIALAASVTFLVLGFAPFGRARRGLGATLMVVALISAPLYISFGHLVEQNKILARVPAGSLVLGSSKVNVSRVNVILEQPPLISVVLSSSERLTDAQLDEFKKILTQSVGHPIQLEAQLNIRR